VTGGNEPQEVSEKSEKLSEKSEFQLERIKVSSVESFCQEALREKIAPRAIGSVKERINFAARKLGWTPSRVKDTWYADPRISISGEELMMVEQTSGVAYARREAQEIDEAIKRATALLVDAKANSPRSLADALIQTARILYSSGNQG